MSNKRKTTNEIYKIIKKRIITLSYEPGLALNEQELAEEFNVSRTPIRTVFKQLEFDELINIVPRYGAQITQINFVKMKSLFELTRILDPYATKLAVKNIEKEDLKELKEIVERLKTYRPEKDYQKAIIDDEKFHQLIIKNAKNPWLEKQLNLLHVHSERLWHYCESYFNDMSIFTNTFSKILKAIEEKNEEDAEKYARMHIDDFVNKIKDEIL